MPKLSLPVGIHVGSSLTRRLQQRTCFAFILVALNALILKCKQARAAKSKS